MKRSAPKPTCFLFLLLTFLFSKSFSQSNTSIILKGNIQNSGTENIEGATLFLKDGNNGKLLNQGSSDKNGTFSFTVAAGNYVISVSYLGALAYQSELLKISGNLDLGTIKLTTTARSLKEVVIQSTGNKPIIRIDGRKMIYDIQKSITTQGSTALEALRKTPGVIVNQDNTVTLNGSSGALVMVNGRQTYLQADELTSLLKSISASDLKTIEIIKNPSAEYDAAGTGGIINLVLQKQLAEGFNGSSNTGVAYGKTIKQNTNVNLNYRKGKLNLFGNYNHRYGYYAMDYDNDRTTNGIIFLNNSHDVDKQHTTGVTAGADFAIDTAKTLGIVMTGNTSSGGGVITPVTHIFDQASGQLLRILRSESTYPEQIARRYNTNLNYRYRGSNRTTLDVDADYGVFDAATDNLSTNSYYSPQGVFQSSNDFLVSNSRDIKLYALKADYGFPLGRGKMLTGAKYSDVSTDNIFNQYDANGTVNVIDVNLSNTFKFHEQISAAYLKYEAPLTEKLSFDAGVRLENTHSTGDLQPRAGSNQSPTSVVRNYLNIFPTASMNYKTSHSGTYNLSFARRIDRPAYNNLNPFSYPVDELSSWRGNPFLQPQYANTLALQYSYKSTTVSASYTHTSNLNSVITEIAEDNLTYTIPRNIGLRNNITTTLTQQLNVTKWWNMSLTGIGFLLQNKVGTLYYGNFNRSRFAGTLNVQQTFKLPAQITAEIAAMANSKNISGLNTNVKSNSQIDLGMQKNILKDNGTLRLAVTDIFWANRINTDGQLNNLLLHTTFRGESRQVRLNFSYRFGNNKIKAKASRETGLQNESERF
jgi:outer membrane receptor protein involved in Fe transport